MYKLKDTDAETFIKKTVEMSENLSKVNYQFLKIGNKEYPVDIEGKQSISMILIVQTWS